MIGPEALICLALNVYHEARSEPLRGQVAVAQVTMKRAERDGKNACRVVFEPHQFSWTAGAVHKGRVKPEYIPAKDDKNWQQAKNIAKQVAARAFPDYTAGADHYHATYVRPKWAVEMVRVAQIGQHIFYREKA